MVGSFIMRRLEFEFRLANNGSFKQPDDNVVLLTGYRASVYIVKVGGIGDYLAQMRIYGVDFSLMNRLNTLGNRFYTQNVEPNQVSIAAGDDMRGMSSIFTGTIYNCWIDFDAAPEVNLVVECSVGLWARMLPIPASSYGQPVDVAIVMQNLAQRLGCAFVNNGVSVMLSCPYFAGTVLQQIEKTARAAGINWAIIGSLTGPLVIWPKGGHAGPPQTKYPVFSPDSGMIGYPTYTQMGISVRSVFTPGQTPEIGEIINVSSSLAPATGQWTPVVIEYNLETIRPNGRWEIGMNCCHPEFFASGQAVLSAENEQQ